MRQLDTCDFCGEQPEGVYEVVPESFGSGPQRLALCASCRDTLQSVVDPLLDAAERGAGDESSTSDAGSGSGTRTDEPAETTDASTETADNTDEQASEPERASTASRADQPDIAMPSGSDSAESTTTAEDSTERESGTDESPTTKPDGYAQVLRLLQNRNEAMARGDLRALATNAYDLGDRTFEQAVDAAVENGDVEETADGLRTL